MQTQKMNFQEKAMATHVNVLLVDDRWENLVTLETLLKKENDATHYILCKSGEEALKIAIKEEIALILLDVQMPGMDGFEVARLLKYNSRTSSIPIIFVTAIDRGADQVAEGFESGAIDFLFKPLNPVITKAKVAAFIRIYLQNRELQQKNHLLLEKQQIINETQELAGIGTWEWDLTMDRLFFSEPLAKLFEIDGGRGIAKSDYLNLIQPADRSGVEALLEKAKKQAGYVFFDYRLMLKGKTIYLIGKCKAEQNAQGVPVKLTGYSQNITSLRQSQALVEHVFDVSPYAICTFTSIRNEQGNITDFRITRVNKAIEAVLGRKIEEISGKRLLDVFPGTKKDGLFEQYRQVVDNNYPLDIEYFYPHDGVADWFHIMAVKLDDGLLLTYTTITERKQAEENLKEVHADLAIAHQSLLQMNNELENRVKERTKDLEQAEEVTKKLNLDLEQKNKDLLAHQDELNQTLKELHNKNFELDQFVYKTSHDLRSPLTTILGLVDILKTEKNEDTKVGYVELIENRVLKLDNFIKSMLDYSRNSRSAMRIEKIDFTAFIAECLDELSYMKNFSHLQVIVDKEEKAGFYSDPFRLKIVFNNLISNAVKYQNLALQESKLTIRIKITGKTCTIHFMDNGIGIRPDYVSKIFDMFFRASDQAEGSGLGMYIVKQAVQMLHGTIQIQSEYGQGTEIQIVLPSIKQP